ncbi:MAG: Holliday junction resolvase RuvX [Acidobacteriota bacterium]
MRALGIDFGEQRIGLAVSDDVGRWAMPLMTIHRTTDRRAAYQIAELARQRDIELLVVGEPLDLEGRAGDAAQRARRFGQRVGKASGLPVHWVNEALTTVEASERLQHRGAGEPHELDAVAAQIILQEALDQGMAP